MASLLLACGCFKNCCLGNRMRSIAEHSEEGTPLAVLWQASRECTETFNSVFEEPSSSVHVLHAASPVAASRLRQQHAALTQLNSCNDANLTALEARARRFAPSAVTLRYTRLFRPRPHLRAIIDEFAQTERLGTECVGLHLRTTDVARKVQAGGSSAGRRNFTEDLLATAEARLAALLSTSPPHTQPEWLRRAFRNYSTSTLGAGQPGAVAMPRVVANSRAGGVRQRRPRWWAQPATRVTGDWTASCVFVATDNLAVVARLRHLCEAWGVRLVRPPKLPPPERPMAAAALDLFLLSRCAWLLGTAVRTARVHSRAHLRHRGLIRMAQARMTQSSVPPRAHAHAHAFGSLAGELFLDDGGEAAVETSGAARAHCARATRVLGATAAARAQDRTSVEGAALAAWRSSRSPALIVNENL